MLDFSRQTGLIKESAFKGRHVTLIGAGAIGSFTALALCKMGIQSMTVYDEDGVTNHNIPNQFYRLADAEHKAFKVYALKNILKDFTGVEIEHKAEFYKDQPLKDIVVVATDDMTSRKIIWKQFRKQHGAIAFVEARMGGQLGIIYTLSKGKTFEKDIKFYEATLCREDEVEPVPCTERAIIYNVAVIAGFISRAVRSILLREKFDKEIAIDMFNVEIYKRN